MSPIEVRAEIVLDARRISEGDFGSVYLSADTLGDAKGGALVRGMVEHLGQITEQTGNSLDAGGRPFSHDLFFEMLDAMDIDFDDDGQAQLQILTTPETGTKIAALPPPTPEQQAHFDALMARKRQEHEGRRRTRRME